MANTVQHAFDIAAEDYDRTRRRLVPGFDDFYRAAIDLIRFPRERALKVLDLGAGTGLMAAFIAYSFPNARITMVDISNEMVERARARPRCHRSRQYQRAIDRCELLRRIGALRQQVLTSDASRSTAGPQRSVGDEIEASGNHLLSGGCSGLAAHAGCGARKNDAHHGHGDARRR